jgi:hypothetical protein
MLLVMKCVLQAGRSDWALGITEDPELFDEVRVLVSFEIELLGVHTFTG